LEFENKIKFLNERNELHKYSIDKNLLDDIILILEPFSKAINDLSSSSVPTLNIVGGSRFDSIWRSPVSGSVRFGYERNRRFANRFGSSMSR
jgi:hypothetical protein